MEKHMDKHVLAKIPRWMLITLVGLWTVAAAGVGVAFFTPQDWTAIPGGLAGALFIIGLCWMLIKLPPKSRAYPSIKAWIKPAPNFWLVVLMIVAVMGMLYGVGQLIDPAFALIGGSALIALVVIFVLRDDISWSIIITGVILGVLVGFSIRFLEFNELSWALLNLNAVALMYVAGMLLLKRTSLGKVRWADGKYSVSLFALLIGIILALPAASLNLVGEIYVGDTWVTRWWQAFAAIGPAVGEEVWARLFLITLFYSLLRPSDPKNAGRAIFVSIVISALVHGVAHTGFSVVAILLGVFFYGIPPALLYIKRDLEHAIGYHFMIDFVRFLAAAIFVAA
jgi:hypothetical protein